MRDNRARGNKAEAAAAGFLINKGIKVLLNNYYTPYGEVDIIASDGGILVFCEVKYRTSCQYGYPREAVDAKKQSRYYQAYSYFVQSNPEYADVPIRFDVIEIIGEDMCIEHLVNAF